jgi:hypothetical protein
MNAKNPRMGFAALVLASVVTAGFCGDAAAKYRSHLTHSRGLNRPGPYAQGASIQENAGPGAMRYHGGPKSPMWRELR